MTWCLWSCPEPEQSWAFPKRLGLFQRGLITIYYYFQKLIECPTTVRQKEDRDMPGPWDNLKGKSCLAGSSLVRAAHWAPREAPCEEELPCRFFSRPVTLSRTGCIPAAPDMGSQRVRHVWATELSCTLPESKCEERSFGLPLEVRMCMANYAKCLERLLKFQRMNGPLEWGYIRRSVGPWSFHGGSEWPVLKGQGSIIEQRWGGVCSQVQKWEFVSFSVLILNYFYLTLQIHIFLPDLSLSENMTIYRIVL